MSRLRLRQARDLHCPTQEVVRETDEIVRFLLAARRWRWLPASLRQRRARSRRVPAPTFSVFRTASTTRRATSRRLRSRDASARVAAAGRARRRARRSDLPEGQAAEERADRAQRVRRRARPHREHPQPRARRLERRLHAAGVGIAIDDRSGDRASAGRRQRRPVARRTRTRFRSAPSSTCGCRTR